MEVDENNKPNIQKEGKETEGKESSHGRESPLVKEERRTTTTEDNERIEEEVTATVVVH